MSTVYALDMETIDKNAHRVRVTVLDVYPGGGRGKSRNITFYRTTAEAVFAAIEALPETADKVVAKS